jgi:hypothetical protein
MKDLKRMWCTLKKQLNSRFRMKEFDQQQQQQQQHASGF